MLQFVFRFLNEHSRFAKVFYILIVIKTLVGFMTIRKDLNDKFIPIELSFHKDFTRSINVDEREMARTAWYKIHTGKFLSDLCFDRPVFRKDSLFISAFRPRFNVLVHVAGLQLYEKSTGKTISNAKQIPEQYFYTYGLILCILKSVLFIISSFFFLGMLLKIFDDPWAKLGACLYVLFPSIFVYIGMMDILENSAMPLLVIFLSFCYIQIDENRTPDLFRSTIFGLVIALACLIRPHTFFILVLFFAGYTVLWFLNYFKTRTVLVFSKTMIVVFLLICCTHIPILLSNHRMFGSYLLSTQPKLEFFQGHNPYARGSWYPMLFDDHAIEFKGMFEQNAALSTADEKQELDFYYKQGLNWILENPAKEVVLSIRKTAIYLLPFNFLNHIFNPLNALVYAGTLGFFLFLVAGKMKLKGLHSGLKLIVLLAPVAGCYFLTLIFFVGERWRYYSEPFMIICALLFFKELVKMMHDRKRRKSLQ